MYFLLKESEDQNLDDIIDYIEKNNHEIWSYLMLADYLERIGRDNEAFTIRFTCKQTSGDSRKKHLKRILNVIKNPKLIQMTLIVIHNDFPIDETMKLANYLEEIGKNEIAANIKKILIDLSSSVLKLIKAPDRRTEQMFERRIKINRKILKEIINDILDM